MIGGLPAARITDLHTLCGVRRPAVAHGLDLEVFIGGIAAARVGDPTGHGGSIVMGCTTVLIGG